MKLGKWCGVILTTAALAGCAHSYSVRPNLNNVTRDQAATRIEASVAYYISSEDLQKQVTTPASGGDRIRYQPYQDIEVGLYKMLSNVFTKVTKVKTPTPSPSNDFTYVIRPSISTTSSGSSILWWPPSDMSMTLTCTVFDPNGEQVTELVVTGEGRATSTEYLANFTVTGQRASEDALMKMQKALLAAQELRH